MIRKTLFGLSAYMPLYVAYLIMGTLISALLFQGFRTTTIVLMAVTGLLIVVSLAILVAEVAMMKRLRNPMMGTLKEHEPCSSEPLDGIEFQTYMIPCYMAIAVMIIDIVFVFVGVNSDGGNPLRTDGPIFGRLFDIFNILGFVLTFGYALAIIIVKELWVKNPLLDTVGFSYHRDCVFEYGKGETIRATVLTTDKLKDSKGYEYIDFLEPSYLVARPL